MAGKVRSQGLAWLLRQFDDVFSLMRVTCLRMECRNGARTAVAQCCGSPINGTIREAGGIRQASRVYGSLFGSLHIPWALQGRRQRVGRALFAGPISARSRPRLGVTRTRL